MKKYYIDYHLHSRFSMDSQVKPKEIVEAALERGLSMICFTEHKDTDTSLDEIALDFYRDTTYSEEIKKLQDKYRGALEIGKGVELDFQEETAREGEEFTQSFRFDFVLCSVHALRHRFVDDDFFAQNDPHLVYWEYLEEVRALSRHKFFDVVGHLDYVKRFGSSFLEFEPARYKDIIGEILDNLVKNGKGLELNTAGWRHSHGESYPSEEILKMYRKRGGEIITIGSDAHDRKSVGHALPEAVEMLKKTGFTGVYAFKDRKPEKIDF